MSGDHTRDSYAYVLGSAQGSFSCSSLSITQVTALGALRQEKAARAQDDPDLEEIERLLSMEPQDLEDELRSWAKSPPRKTARTGGSPVANAAFGAARTLKQ